MSVVVISVVAIVKTLAQYIFWFLYKIKSTDSTVLRHVPDK